VPSGEQRDDPVGLAQLVDAQHDRLVPVQRHASIVPPSPDVPPELCGMRADGRVLSAAMRIAVLGTGNIGGTLGTRWIEASHEVVFGGRSARADGPGGNPVVPAADAVGAADAVLLAVPAAAVTDLLGEIGEQLDGKVVVDATNNIRGAVANAHDAVTGNAPGASYARAFNTLGWENFADPLPESDLFYAADADAREITEDLISSIGLRPVYVGDAAAAGTVDALLGLWFALMQQRGSRRLAFRALW
jgi:predicted dinucleotide-binding enzyme